MTHQLARTWAVTALAQVSWRNGETFDPEQHRDLVEELAKQFVAAVETETARLKNELADMTRYRDIAADSAHQWNMRAGELVTEMARAVAEEREACALIAEGIGNVPKFRDGSGADWVKIAVAIRARGATPPAKHPPLAARPISERSGSPSHPNTGSSRPSERPPT